MILKCLMIVQFFVCDRDLEKVCSNDSSSGIISERGRERVGEWGKSDWRL